MINKQWKNFNRLHMTLLVILVVLQGIAYLVVGATDAPFPELGMTAELGVPLLAMFFIFVGHLLYKNKLKEVKEQKDAKIQLSGYMRISVIRWATAESAALLAAVTYVMTHHHNLILYSAMISVMIMYFRPIRSRLVEDLQWSESQAEELDN